MHRTQVQLEDWQYESLKSASEREGRSLATLVRDAVTEYLQGDGGERSGGLSSIAGIGSDEKGRGSDHDQYLYGGSASGSRPRR